MTIVIEGDGSEIFDFSLPHPYKYSRKRNVYTLKYALQGTFYSQSARDYLNDILARFTLSMDVKRIDWDLLSNIQDQNLELKQFQGLKSISKAKDYSKVDCGHDNIFWSIKLHLEALIKEYGEGKLIAYSLIESYAFLHFIALAKDQSTLKAKCRSIWNWYNERNWTIPVRKGKGMTRQEVGKYSAEINAKNTKAKVIGAVEALNFLQKKVNVSNVSRQANVSRNTAKKYLIELGLNNTPHYK